jgi:hypothetical protein
MQRLLPVFAVTLIASVFVIYGLSQASQRSQHIAQAARAWVLTMEALPALCMTLFAALVIRVRLALGFWPYPGHFDGEARLIDWVESPFDPKGFPVHHQIVGWTCLFSLFSLSFVMPAFVMLRSVRSKYWVHAFTFWVVTYAIGVAWLLTDPGQFILWFID